MTKEIGVLLADDHPIIEAAARAILAKEPDINLLAAAYDGAQAQHLACLHQPDILLLDLYMPGPCAEETVQKVQQCSPHTKIVIFTACDDESEVRSMVAMKVAGYMLKNELSARVVEAMRTVAQGGFWFSQGILMKLVHHEPEKLPSSPAIPLQRWNELFYNCW
jgi:DNA-binding NarL/FixJ family response regulator